MTSGPHHVLHGDPKHSTLRVEISKLCWYGGMPTFQSVTMATPGTPWWVNMGQ